MFGGQPGGPHHQCTAVCFAGRKVAGHRGRQREIDSNIGINSIRAGNIVGDHTVAFVSDTETVELTHHSVDRELFASGALQAAQWLADRQPGLYGMRDVLGFK
jgi:4-hydroxy-tetrahydrodipicolinate reductase